MTAQADRTTDADDAADDAVPTAILVVGAPASGKSTVGRLLAERLRPGAFIEGDTPKTEDVVRAEKMVSLT